MLIKKPLEVIKGHIKKYFLDKNIREIPRDDLSSVLRQHFDWKAVDPNALVLGGIQGDEPRLFWMRSDTEIDNDIKYIFCRFEDIDGGLSETVIDHFIRTNDGMLVVKVDDEKDAGVFAIDKDGVSGVGDFVPEKYRDGQ